MASPEVEALLKTSRELVSEGFQIARAVNQTIDELEVFRGKIERRHPSPASYEGQERRGA